MLSGCRGFIVVRGNKKTKYHWILNKHDTFDQLIMELERNGTLDVSIVGIQGKT